MDKYEALRRARGYWELDAEEKNRSYLMLLGRTGIFTHVELAKIGEVSPAIARNATTGLDLPRFRYGDKFDPRTIDSMLLVMEHFSAHGTVPRGMMELILPYTSMSVISRMTGIGVTDLANPEPLRP